LTNFDERFPVHSLKIAGYFLKILGWVSLALVLLAAIATFLVYQFKDRIIQVVVTELNKQLNSEVLVEKIDIAFWETFPNVSIEFSKIEIKGSKANYPVSFVKADKLFLSFDVMDLYQGKYQVSETLLEDANLHFIIFPNGDNNFTVFKKSTKDSDTSEVAFKLDKLVFKNVNVLFENQINEQKYDLFCKQGQANFALKGSSWEANITSDLFVHSVSVEKHSYLTSKQLQIKTSILFDDQKGYYTIKPSDIVVGNSLFTLTGTFGIRTGQDISLSILGKNTNIQTILALLPADIHQKLSIYKSEGDIYLQGSIKGKVDSRYAPEASFAFGCRNASFWHPEYQKKVKQLSFKGFYSNGKKSEGQTSFLRLQGLQGNIDDRPFSADFEMKNFVDPFVKFSFNGSFDLENLAKIIEFKHVLSLKGEMSADIFFEGLLKDLKDTKTLKQVNAYGNLQVRNGQCVVKANQYVVKNLHQLLSFDNTSIHLHEFSANIQNQEVFLKGYLYNYLPYLAGTDDHLEGELQLKSAFINLENWLVATPSTTTEKSSKSMLNDQMKFVLLCDIQKLAYKTFNAQQVRGKVTLQNHRLEADNINMKAADGNFFLDGHVDLTNSNHLVFDGKAKCQNMKVDSLFILFDNFGQSYITEKHLKGTLTADADLHVPFDGDYKLKSKSLKTLLNVSIKNGELNNFQPMQSLSRFIDKEELSNIRFQELKNTIRIENEVVYFPEMEIKSNINTIGVLGTTTFDGMMDYKLKVSVRNYKKDKDEAFGAIKEEGGNTTLFLTMKGNADNVKFAYDTQAVKDKVKDSWKKEKEEFKSLFKTSEPVNQEKNKPVEVKEDEYIEID
jgi:uncharacterized protein involved in outer membrane biogenesis